MTEQNHAKNAQSAQTPKNVPQSPATARTPGLDRTILKRLATLYLAGAAVILAATILAGIILQAAGAQTWDPWAPVRECESTSSYTAVNPNDWGTPSMGAYQFKQQTWDWVAAHAGRTWLIGLPPHHASPADQDAQAETLRTMPGGGLGHWPRCGHGVYGQTYRGVDSWTPAPAPAAPPPEILYHDHHPHHWTETRSVAALLRTPTGTLEQRIP